MVKRGVVGRDFNATARKLQSTLRGEKLTREITRMFRRGDSQTSIVRALRDSGISTTRRTLTNYFIRTKSFQTLQNYERMTLDRFGARSRFSLKHFVGRYQAGDILFRIKVRLSSGTVRDFNLLVKHYEDQTLDDIYGEIENLYGESNLDSDTAGEIIAITPIG